MSELLPFGQSNIPGVRRFWRYNPDGSAEIITQQDVGEIIENNKAMAVTNDGYTASKDFRRVASIPVTVMAKWLAEEGWDPYSEDPGCQKKLAQKLDDPEWRHLRTAHFHLGDSWKHNY